MRENEPDRWKRYLLRTGDEETRGGAGSSSTGDPPLEPPAVDSEQRRDRKRGNEDQSHAADPASTGGSMPGDGASSTRRRPYTPPDGQDPKDDPADYLFGPDGEEKPEKPDNVAALTCPTAVSCAGKTEQENGDLEKNGLVHRICSVDVCEIFSPPRVTAEALSLIHI